MSHIARGGALRDVQRVTEAIPCVASVCQGMQGVERREKEPFLLYLLLSVQLLRKKNLLCKDHLSITIYDVVTAFELLVLT